MLANNSITDKVSAIRDRPLHTVLHSHSNLSSDHPLPRKYRNHSRSPIMSHHHKYLRPPRQRPQLLSHLAPPKTVSAGLVRLGHRVTRLIRRRLRRRPCRRSTASRHRVALLFLIQIIRCRLRILRLSCLPTGLIIVLAVVGWLTWRLRMSKGSPSVSPYITLKISVRRFGDWLSPSASSIDGMLESLID